MEPVAAKETLLAQIGGETVLRGLVDCFYDLIETDPRGEPLLRLHFRGHGLDHAREEQFNFLCGFLGGPRHYLEKHGHMDVRLMHAHVPISAGDAEDWLALMDRAIAEMRLSGPQVDKMRLAFRRVALTLVNDLGEWGWEAPDDGGSSTSFTEMKKNMPDRKQNNRQRKAGSQEHSTSNNGKKP